MTCPKRSFHFPREKPPRPCQGPRNIPESRFTWARDDISSTFPARPWRHHRNERPPRADWKNCKSRPDFSGCVRQQRWAIASMVGGSAGSADGIKARCCSRSWWNASSEQLHRKLQRSSSADICEEKAMPGRSCTDVWLPARISLGWGAGGDFRWESWLSAPHLVPVRPRWLPVGRPRRWFPHGGSQPRARAHPHPEACPCRGISDNKVRCF